MNKVIIHEGRAYVAVEALRAAANDPRILAQAALMIKVGADKGASLAEVLAIVLASYVSSTTGEIPSVALSEAELEGLMVQLRGRLSPVSLASIRSGPTGNN